MNTQTTLDRLKPILARQLGCEGSDVIPEANFKNDLGADSLDTIEIVMEIEEEWSIAETEEMEDAIHRAETVADVIKIIEEATK